MCNDLERSYRAVGVYPTVLVSLIVHNVQHGPDRDEGLRWSQLSESLRFLMPNFTPENCALFEFHSAAMLRQLGDKVTVERSDSPNEALWAFLQEGARFRTKGHRVNFCRFMAYIRANKQLLSEWSSTCFLAEFLALEHDFLSGKAFREKLLVKGGLAVETSTGGTTSSVVTQVGSKLLRGCCANAIAITVMFLTEPVNFRIISVITRVPSALGEWHGLSNASMRSVLESIAWVSAQLRGEFAAHLRAVIASLGAQGVGGVRILGVRDLGRG